MSNRPDAGRADPRSGAAGAGRLAAVRRAPFAPAALVLAAFAAVGVAVLDDYGVAEDETAARPIGQAVVNSALPGAADLPADRIISPPDYRYRLLPHDRYYGAAFEAPLLLVERILGLTDSRAVLLARRLLTHLFFLTGGFFCYLLVYRLFGDRYLALFALLLFLLHPRLYAHSFFNSKDLSFVAMFMIALYLLQRAFRRDTAAAFAACGAGVGVLINLRVMGVMLFAAVLGLRALDLLQARGRAERRRVLAAAGAFALAAAGTLYALSPYLWRDPFAIIDALATLSRHPNHHATLFQGELVRWPSIPPHFIPTWMAITTPAATLLLCLIGAVAVVRRGLARPGAILRCACIRNTPMRFAWLLLACLTLPPAAVAALQANAFHDGRHLYFLYAPLCLLAVYGLRALLAGTRRPAAARPGGGGGRLRRAVCALAAAALAGSAIEIVRLHPYQHGYFNVLVDRRTPERLRAQYVMLYWNTEFREGLEYLLARFPDATLRVAADSTWDVWRSRLILPAEARRRIVVDAGRNPQFFITGHNPDDLFAPVLHVHRIYRNTVLAVTAVDLSLLVDDKAAADGYHAAFRAAVAAREPLVGPQFDLSLDGAALIYAKEPCRPEDTARPFRLRAVPVAVEDLPVTYREDGWQPLDFRFARYGVRFGGRCLIRRPLPDYPVRALEVGRGISGFPYPRLLEAVIDLSPEQPPVSASAYWRSHAEIAAGGRGAPAARATPAGRAAPAGRAGFELYLDEAGAELIYHKEPCAPGDLRGRFYLHLFPADPAELAGAERQSGFHNYSSFLFPQHGVLLPGGACVALVPLPAYERGIARVRTSQVIDGAAIWSADFRAGE